MIELIGWLGAACFALCGLPQAYVCYKQGHGRGVSNLFMWIWLAGELLTMPYIYFTHGLDPVIFFNLTLNTIFIIIILRYIYFPREPNAQL